MISSEHESDFHQWSQTQAEVLRKKEFAKLDIENLIEELQDLGMSEESKLESHLNNLIMHMLKAKYQPNMHTRSWDLSIKESKQRAKRVLKKNPSLKCKLDEIIEEAYSTAEIRAARETGLDEEIFPEKCPWNLKEIFPDL